MLNGNGADLYYVILDIHYTIQYKSISSISSISLSLYIYNYIYIYHMHIQYIYIYIIYIIYKVYPSLQKTRAMVPEVTVLKVTPTEVSAGLVRAPNRWVLPETNWEFWSKISCQVKLGRFSLFFWFLRCFFAILMIEIDKLKDFFWDLRTGEIREKWNLRVFFLP